MPAQRTPDGGPHLGNDEPGKAHWPVDLELHPDKDADQGDGGIKPAQEPLKRSQTEENKRSPGS